MKRFSKVFIASVFVVSAFVLPFTTASAQPGWYMGVFGGYTFSPDASAAFYDYNYYYYSHDIYDLDVQETWGFGFKFGYTPPALKFASFEFEYSYIHPDVDREILTYTGYDYVVIEGDATLHNFMFNAIVKYPEGTIHPYVGAGVGSSYVDVSISSTSTTHAISNDDSVFAWQILVGIDMELADNLSLDIGYRYFATDADSEYDHYDYDDYDTRLEYETGMITFGLTYKFQLNG